MTLVDYTTHFWGEKHIGYHVLYENLKKGENSVQEFVIFVKERISIEDDVLKSLIKSLNRVNNYVDANGTFVNFWRSTKGTLELWVDIQNSLLKNLGDLLKDVIKYHDNLVKSRKRSKEYDVLDAVNLIQTTTTCLQKAKETYHQRYTEVMNIKNEVTNVKEFFKAKNKLNKAHEEYKSYVEKYNQVRGTFEEKMLKVTKVFQSHDESHLNQMKNFFLFFARNLDNSYTSISQMISNYRQDLEKKDVTEIMRRFVAEKSTGLEKPQPIIWTNADEIPSELETISNNFLTNTNSIISANSSQSAPSSNSSTVVANLPQNSTPTVNDLLGIGETWKTYLQKNQHRNSEFDLKSDDSDFDNGNANVCNQTNHSYIPQFSSWLGRQKIAQWRKKHSASQSNLPTTSNIEINSTSNDFSLSYNTETNSSTTSGSFKGNFLSKYRKSKNSVIDLTGINETSKNFLLTTEDNRSVASSLKSDEKTNSFNNLNTSTNNNSNLVDSFMLFCTSDLKNRNSVFLPSSQISDFKQSAINSEKKRKNSLNSFSDENTSTTKKTFFSNLEISNCAESGIFSTDNLSNNVEKNKTNVLEKTENTLVNKKKNTDQFTDQSTNQNLDSSSSDDDEIEFQTSKIRSLQIKPINESNSKINASVDELRNAIDHFSLHKSSTFENDPWTSINDEKNKFLLNINNTTHTKPIRAALTGDENLRRKFSEFDTMLPPFDFKQNTNLSNTTSSIIRSRPRSYTPTAQFLHNASVNQQPILKSKDFNQFFKINNDNEKTSTNNFLSLLNNKSNSNSLSNIAINLTNDMTFSNANSSSPITFTINNQQNSSTQQNRQKLPVAMALNEYIHVWFKGEDTSKTIVRIFGSIIISLPVIILTHLLDSNREIKPLKFSLKNASQIKSILSNQKFVQLQTKVSENSTDVYTFSIDQKCLIDWLLEQQKNKPNSTYHNIDLVRYELDKTMSSKFVPPLEFTTYWRTEPGQTDLRIDYKLNNTVGLAAHTPLLNIIFLTNINGNVTIFNSDPEAKWLKESNVLSWTLTELSKHGDCNGSLKARLKLADNFVSTPVNTSVQFQMSDISVSNIILALENEQDYVLNMVRRKVFAGKYFCEPEIR